MSTFHEEQARAFADYFSKTAGKDLLKLFNEWAFSKDFSEEDKQEIWRFVVKAKPRRTRKLRKDSEQVMRLAEVLEILLKADLKYLAKLLEKQRKKRDLKNGE